MRKPVNTYPDRSGFTNDEAEALLDKLRTHYNQPVMPLGRVCNAVYDWYAALRQLEARSKKKNESYFQGSAYLQFISHIITDINKSGLLFRMLYLGEDLRTEICPTHEGEMDIQIWIGFPDAGTCECGGTGWLPNKP